MKLYRIKYNIKRKTVGVFYGDLITCVYMCICVYVYIIIVVVVVVVVLV